MTGCRSLAVAIVPLGRRLPVPAVDRITRSRVGEPQIERIGSDMLHRHQATLPRDRQLGPAQLPHRRGAVAAVLDELVGAEHPTLAGISGVQIGPLENQPKEVDGTRSLIERQLLPGFQHRGRVEVQRIRDHP